MDSDSASNDIVQFLENKTILITGGTGFLAKILLEKILRIQPNIAKIYLLIRASDSNSLMRRFENEVMGKELFRVLKRKYGSCFDAFITGQVEPVAGDVSCDNLGVKDLITIKQMCNNLDIIVGFAATTNLNERYDVAMGTNTMGALRVLRFAEKCVQLKMLLHVSTAYVSGEKKGTILETPFRMGETLLRDGEFKLDIDGENLLVEDKLNVMRSKNTPKEAITSTMKELGLTRARAHGWPNTYVFTKAMGEMILRKFKENVPLIILRPAMVTSTFRQPFPGWIEGLRTLDSVAGAQAKGKIKFLPCDPHSTIDAIPADMVINSILMAIVVHVKRCSLEAIYHIGSSSKNPISLSTIQHYNLEYFTKNPLTNENGKSIKVERIIAFDTIEKWHNHMMIRYMLPLKILKFVNIIACQYYKDLYATSKRKIEVAMRLIDIWHPYLSFKGIFDDTNSEKLRIEARKMGLLVIEDEDDGFNFDPRSIDWRDYFINTHFPGLVKHVILRKRN